MPIAQADTIYPDNEITGSTSTTGSAAGRIRGRGLATDCTLLLGLLDVSTTRWPATPTPTHAAGIGTPPGSLQQAYQPPADGLAPLLFEATAIARPRRSRSPHRRHRRRFQFDRRADVDAILDGSTASATLHVRRSSTSTDGGAPARELVHASVAQRLRQHRSQGRLNEPDGPASSAGHTYRLELEHDRSTRDPARVGAADSTIAQLRQHPPARRRRHADVRARRRRSPIRRDATISRPTTAHAQRPDERPAACRRRTRSATARPTRRRPPPTHDDRRRSTAARGRRSQPRSRTITGLTRVHDVLLPRSRRRTRSGHDGRRRDAVVRDGLQAPTSRRWPVDGLGRRRRRSTAAINPQQPRRRTYFYEYGDGRAAARSPPHPGDAGGSSRSPAARTRRRAQQRADRRADAADTTYQVRVVADQRASARRRATSSTFTTPGTGATGADGSARARAATSRRRRAPRAPPARPAPPGATGAPGAPGAARSGRSRGHGELVGHDPRPRCPATARAMVRIDATRISVPTRGRNIGRVRVQIFCRGDRRADVLGQREGPLAEPDQPGELRRSRPSPSAA